ncbi:MAG: class I SAM-dependent methyltransferase [Rhodospirillales bacterium]|jgi:SAM-dependent methyltransferase|nr:class I SAM-dependent methyltransferase [Rhodospirillales bacterium]
MFETLMRATARPQPFAHYTAPQLWNDPHVSRRMLELHLDPDADLASRPAGFVDRSASWVVARFRLRTGRAVCDLGCGPGLYATRFARAGAAVTGVDLSQNAIAYARKAAVQDGLTIDYVLGNYLETTPDGPFDLITLIFCDFCVLNPDQRGILLDRMRTMLAKGGSVLLDVNSLACFAAITETTTVETATEGGFWSADPYVSILSVFKYGAERLILSKYTIFERNRTREYCNWIQCYDPLGLADLFAEHGLRLTKILGNVAGDAYDAESNEFAVIAEKAERI